MKRRIDWLWDLLPVWATLATLFVAAGAWIVQSHFEARAFNRVTGSDVSTWDAMWVELRVQEDSR